MKKQKVKKIKRISSTRYRVFMAVVILLFFLLILRIGWIQFVEGASLKESAYKQQTINSIISTKRGTIYDATGKKLAMSAQVDTISINPSKIIDKNNDEQKTKEKKELVAKGLSQIFELDYNSVLEKVNKNSSFETIIKKVDQEKVDELKKWMSDNKITEGINIDEDSKRAYPYNNLAAQVIGFCGDDNEGLEGLELKWNSVLTGTPGKLVTSKDAVQEEIPDQNQTYIPAQDGSDLVLTLDVNLQSIVEKYLKQAVIDNNCKRGGNAILMDPKTGDILAMASYPDYDLNTPFTPNTESLKSSWETFSSSEKTSLLQQMWRNKSVSDTYEPGSTFKLVTAAIALEENITSSDIANDFICNGHEVINGITINCWSQRHKGGLSLRQALQYSCNPSFMQLGKRIGTYTLYKYYNAFGFFEKTNVDMSGEASGIFHKIDNVGNIELATMSFGQRFTITPLQMASAVCAIVNDGVLMQPRTVKEIINPETGTSTTIEPIVKRQVISKETSETMRNMMESVVTDGSRKTCCYFRIFDWRKNWNIRTESSETRRGLCFFLCSNYSYNKHRISFTCYII